MDPVEKYQETMVFETHDRAHRILTGSRLLSFDHGPGWRKKLGGNEDIGGPFYVARNTFGASASVTELTQFGDWTEPWQGNLTPWNGSYGPHNWPISSSLSSVNTLVGLGTEAINKTIPTAPIMNVSVSVGELIREGLPRMIGLETLKNKFNNLNKTVADEYLNLEFGWKPIISDLRSLAIAVKDTNRILDQYLRDSGRRVRRTYKFPLEVTDDTTIISNSIAAWGDGDMGPFMNAGTVPSGRNWEMLDGSITRKTSRRIWFKGTYSYFVPPIDSVDKLAQYEAYANKLLGTRITPETVWNLIPWTWLIDWFSNIGDVISNASRFASDELVLHHGYIMEHVSSADVLEVNGRAELNTNGSPKQDVKLTASFGHETKTRIAANPYGFAVDFTLADLTPRQTAILAALMQSRSPRRYSIRP